MNVDLRSIVFFLHLKGKKPIKILCDINETFKEDMIGYSTVTKFIRESKYSSNNEEDEKKTLIFTISIILN